MRSKTAIVLYVLAMVGVVVGVDVLFLRHDTWGRLIANIGIVAVFATFYLRFLKGSVAGRLLAGSSAGVEFQDLG